MTEKIIGYVLFCIGLLVIIFSTYAGYQVFTKQAQPIDVFHFPNITMDVTQALTSGLPKELTQNLPPQRQEIIPAEMINQPMNFFTYLIFMGFMASTGAKLAGLGIQLIRPIVVKMHEKPSPS